MSEPALQTTDLTKFYGRSRGIEGLDLRVERGEVFGFLGPNGAGKTTTIRLLLDLIRPSRGQAQVLGMDARERSVEVRRHTSYLPGELRLPEQVTARGFLSHLGRLRGGVPAEEIDRLSERIGLEPERHIGDLSKGNKQKVGIVAAWMHDPDLLILDEPTSGLDPLRQHDVQEMMRERVVAGRTVFLSSHELDQVEHVADRVGIIREGQMVAVEAVNDLKERRVRQMEIRFMGEVPTEDLRGVRGVTDVVAKNDRARVRVEGSMDPLIKALANHEVQTLTSDEPELEELFLSYYDGSDGER